MRRWVNTGLVFLLMPFTFLMGQKENDSVARLLPKHYFSTLLSLDLYRKPEQPIPDTSRKLDRILESYGVKQTYITFYTPILTREWKGKKEAIANAHLLITATYLSLRPEFAGISDHRLVKTGLGLRYIHNSGRKGVWFIDVSPFVTRDATARVRPYYRMASTIVYSHNHTPSFNWRMGITKSFLWGNRLYLPFIGLRFGRIDKTHLSVQFPRNISFNMVLGRRVMLSLYTRPQGGMFIFGNTDSLYFVRTDRRFHFTRYELNSGLRGEFRARSRFALFIATGLSSRNNITFYSERANKTNGSYRTFFYRRNLPPTFYLNLGFTLSMGRSRSYYYNKNIYDAIDLAGDHNSNLPVPLEGKLRTSDMNLRSVSDLVEFIEP